MVSHASSALNRLRFPLAAWLMSILANLTVFSGSPLVKINCDAAFKDSTAAIAIVGLDSSGSILHVYDTVPPWSIDALVADIRLWSKNMNLTFSWTSRHNNKVAHYAARLASSSTFSFSWDVSFPVELTSLARSDVHCRLCYDAVAKSLTPSPATIEKFLSNVGVVSLIYAKAMLILNLMDKEGFQFERLAQLEYGVLPSSGYGVLDRVSFVIFGERRHIYAVFSLMDTACWLSDQYLVSSGKFPYLKKESLKRTGRDCDGRVIILPPTIVDEHIAVQRESKARTTLLQSIPDDHVADFHYMDDARDIWNAVKARFGGNAESKKMRKSMLKQEFLEFRISEAKGLHKGYERMQKILSQLNQLKAKPEDEDINLKFLRALPLSWSQVALTLKTKGGLEPISFDELQSAGPSHSAFVSTTSASKKMSYLDSPCYSSSTYTAPSNSKTGSHRSGNIIEDVLQSFVVDTEPEQQLAYEDFDQIEKLDLEEMDLKWQMAMLSVQQEEGQMLQGVFKEATLAEKAGQKVGKLQARYSSYQYSGDEKKEEESKALNTYMIAGCETEDAIEEGAAKIYNLITGANTKEAITVLCLLRELLSLGCHLLSYTTNSEEVEGRPHFNRFAKTDSMKVVPPPLSGDYTPLSDHTDLDESQMSYGTKSSTSGDSNSVSNDFVSCDNSDKSSEVNSNDFAFSDSSVKSSEPKSNDSTSCASTSSISTSESEAEIESNVRKNVSSISKLCFVCGSSTHLIKDCDFYEKQMANKTVGNGVGPVHSRNNANHQNQFVQQAVLLRTGKVNITPARPQSVPTGKPKVPAPVPTSRQNRPIPVPTGRQNRPIPVPTGRGDSPSVTSGWWQSTARPMPHLIRPTSSYFQTYTPYVPQMYYNHMQYDGVRWATAVKPSAVSHFKPFGYHVTILNTSDHLGKFDGKADEGYIVGYSASNRAYRVYNVHNKRVEETMNLRYLEEKPNVQGLGHEWYFDLDYLTDTLGYKRVQANQSAGTQEASTNPAGTQDADSDSECDEQVIIIPSYPSHSLQEAEPKDTSSDEGDDSPHDSAKKLYQQSLQRLKGSLKKEQTSDVKEAEELHFQTRSKVNKIRREIGVGGGVVGAATSEPRSVAQPIKIPAGLEQYLR
ncbi:hypothetical protein Tco_0681355 [Tanacetum coccineum]|uniref:Retroviral polymerase SH3-like domain-containing protein n=1 Tax=Tanacetum coccineum TaxID=301880 RepID=A0ABQ4XNW6_9ASTR